MGPPVWQGWCKVFKSKEVRNGTFFIFQYRLTKILHLLIYIAQEFKIGHELLLLATTNQESKLQRFFSGLEKESCREDNKIWRYNKLYGTKKISGENVFFFLFKSNNTTNSIVLFAFSIKRTLSKIKQIFYLGFFFLLSSMLEDPEREKEMLWNFELFKNKHLTLEVETLSKVRS